MGNMVSKAHEREKQKIYIFKINGKVEPDNNQMVIQSVLGSISIRV